MTEAIERAGDAETVVVGVAQRPGTEPPFVDQVRRSRHPRPEVPRGDAAGPSRRGDRAG